VFAKEHWKILVAGLVCLLIFFLTLRIHSQTKGVLEKLKMCPEILVEDRMPCVSDLPGGCKFGKYYILNGKRRELSEFDQEWVEINCEVKESVVY
jgi:hypothetical protein